MGLFRDAFQALVNTANKHFGLNVPSPEAEKILEKITEELSERNTGPSIELSADSGTITLEAIHRSTEIVARLVLSEETVQSSKGDCLTKAEEWAKDAVAELSRVSPLPEKLIKIAIMRKDGHGHMTLYKMYSHGTNK